MSITKWKKLSITTSVIVILLYAPFGISKAMRIAGLENYWVVSWTTSYLLYIIAGMLFVHLLEKKEEIVLAGIAAVVLGVHWLICGSSLTTKYFLSHSFYGFLVLTVTMLIYRLK